MPWPVPIKAIYEITRPLHLVGGYGLFAIMTTKRGEIIFEGSNDREVWHDYEFKHKPGNLESKPTIVAPHQPRLDWQMWFASLGSLRQNSWVLSLAVRLLQGSEPVLGLLKENPFPESPPQYIRAVYYDYEFTDKETKKRTGQWWSRTKEGLYLPPISLDTIRQLARGSK